MKRRKFMGLVSSACVCGTYLHAFPSKAQSGISKKKFTEKYKTPHKDYQINPSRIYLEEASFGELKYDFSRNQRLVFDNVLWSPDASKGMQARNIILGNLIIDRHVSGPEVEYSINLSTNDYKLNGTLLCSAEGLRTIKSFKFRNIPKAAESDDALMKLSCCDYSGDLKNDRLTMSFCGVNRSFDALKLPVLSIWQLLDSPDIYESLSEAGKLMFFKGPSDFLTEVNFSIDGEGLILPSKDECCAYMCAGKGVYPIHFLRSKSGIGLGCMSFVNSFVIKSVENI